MSKKTLRKNAIWFALASAVCFLIFIVGMLWLYFTGYTGHLVPQPIMAALVGCFLYGVLAVICFMLSEPKPPRGGKRRQSTSTAHFAAQPSK